MGSKMTSKGIENQKLVRSPIVVVMGHVDHGKTSLLDYIRKTNVAGKEAGGITQATGAYEITHNEKRITFIDTPGHEAFSKMRSRGAHVADLAILVVAADDGVKPQTKESIQILKQSETPFVVAINKIDKNNADPERVKQELAQNEVQLEGYGGSISFQPISAKTGEGVPELLDLILLAAEFEDLTYNPTAPASGFVIEARLEKSRGNEVMVIVKNGVLKQGTNIYTATAKGRVRGLQNFLGKNEKEFTPSSPAMILGFEDLPQVGEEFSEGDAPERSVEKQEKQRVAEKTDKEKSLILRIILKADVSGSLEAVSQIVKALKFEEVNLEVLHEAVGGIADGDVKSAIASKAAIFGFNVKAEKAAETLAKNNDIKIVISNIIYDLVKKVEDAVNELKSPEPLGVLEVLAIFNQKTHKQLIGGKVLDGVMKNKAYCDVWRVPASSVELKTGETASTKEREAVMAGKGRILSLKKQKQDAALVDAGNECGMIFESNTKIIVGDKIVIPAPTKLT
ncbi:MAG: translation initiation factor IF-2 [Candidatus Liptonbacteria bacterium]|nr:translation initiation factor IF-2 [Candidatus Liptonbacteria bacterium]